MKYIKKIILWVLFLLVLCTVSVVLLNFRYFVLQYQLLVSGKPPEIEAPQISKNSQTLEKNEKPNYLWIPSLGIEAPIVYVDGITDQIFQEALGKGVVHFPQTAKPGEYGNCYIFGHSSDYAWSKGSYKTVFALLTKIQPGAEILVSDSIGKVYFYKVLEAKVVSKKDVGLLSQEKYTKKLLTLQTSYPIGTALKRYIVRAELSE